MSLALVVNCGSSSIKFKLYSTATLSPLLSGSASSLQGDCAPQFHYTTTQHPHDKVDRELDSSTSYEQTFDAILKEITHGEGNRVLRGESIGVVCHRIVHGGENEHVITIHHGDKDESKVLDQMEQVSAFAPLHVGPVSRCAAVQRPVS